ncbi:MAG: hypothetical protein ACKV19_22345 [Verrucomicrobiales bacterium]
MSRTDHHECHGDQCCPSDEELIEEVADEPSLEEVFGLKVPSEPLLLRAGPVEVQFDPDWGIVRGFVVGGREAVRAIYPAVRSSKWKTIPPRIIDLRVDAGEDSFRLTFACEHVDAEAGIDFAWRGEVTGGADGSVSYQFDGVTRRAMETNRTGLCVLHPILPMAGRPVTVRHGDGRVVATDFPALISPHQPFFDVASLRHEVAPGLRVRVDFEGGVFETEDQRNWTDASYKSYGGALSIPLPLRWAADHAVMQKVTVSLAADTVVPAPVAAGRRICVSLPSQGTTRLPSIGPRFAPEAGEPEESLVAQWREWAPGHLMVDVDLTTVDWQDRLKLGRAWAWAMGACVLLRVVFTPNHQPALARLAGVFGGAEDLMAVVVVGVGEPCPGAVTMGLVAAAFARAGCHVPMAAAPADNFADMNRFRPSSAYWAAPPMCPQVHTFDHVSIMQNLEAQPALLATVRSFNPHPLLIGPVALLRRRVADARQGSYFAAAWTAGSLAAVLPTGLAAAVTYHEHAGPMGIPGTPCAGVFGGLAGATSTARTVVSDPSAVAALCVFDPSGDRRVLLANLTRHSVAIAFDDGGDDIEFGPYVAAWVEM